MARFFVIHRLAPHVTQEQVIAGASQLAASLTPGTKWMNSWWVQEAERLFCEWEAPDADAIRASLEQTQDQLPIESLYEVQWIDPQWYE